jgi:hypothetical protein
LLSLGRIAETMASMFYVHGYVVHP